MRAKSRLGVHDWRIDFLGREIRQANHAGSTQPLSDQAAAADDVPDQESPEGSEGDQAGAEQDGDGSTEPRPGFGALVKDLTQPASSRFTCLRGLAA